MSRSSRPGVGKTTVMRGISRVLSDQLLKRVVCALVALHCFLFFQLIPFSKTSNTILKALELHGATGAQKYFP